MNSKTMTLEQAVEGYLLNIRARRLTKDTISYYTRIMHLVVKHFPKETLFADITVEDLEEFLAAQDGVSDKTVLNYHTVLSSLYTWATSRRPPLATDHLMRQITRPKPEQRIIQPLTESEVRAMLNNTDKSHAYSRPGKRTCTHTIPNAQRNRAIILLLVDTGIRASELCTLKINDINLKTFRVHVFGKGKKEREVRMCARTSEAIWKYLTERPDARPEDPLFITSQGNAFTRNRLGRIIENIGERAGINDPHPHRFRHTFAVQFLRNGGDPYTLQDLLGHETMDMVRRYLHLAQVDLDAGHRLASPVDNWRL